MIMTTGLARYSGTDNFGAITDISRKNTGRVYTMGAPKSAQEGVSTGMVATLDPKIAGEF